ncbi:hypothetical protein L3i20_v237130 [Paenibacillus sp. L3-i20]|nr:hypothetical protein L3i20_v237130 [Paenibacillus sp. L3-i20]
MKCKKCKEVDIPEPQFCCIGIMCGCMGLPIEPPFCKGCWEELIGEERREKYD